MALTASPHLERIASNIVESAFRVHSQLGPGLLESIYETCLDHELRKRRLAVLRQLQLPVVYDGMRLESALRIDMLVDQEVIVEVKTVERLMPVHEAQLLSYLRLAGKKLGLLINFNVPLIKHGIRRLIL